MSLAFHNNFLLDTMRPYLERKTKTLHTRKDLSSAWHAAGVHRPAYHKKTSTCIKSCGRVKMIYVAQTLRCGLQPVVPSAVYRTLEAMPCQHAGLFRTSLGGVALLSFQQVQDADRAHTESRRRRAAHAHKFLCRESSRLVPRRQKEIEREQICRREGETPAEEEGKAHTQVR